MRSVFRKILPIVLCLLLISGLVSGCASPGQHRAWREKAEKHLGELQKKVGDADHFTLQKDKPSAPDKAAEIIFHVYSEAYGDYFSLFVLRDESFCTDDYYSLYLKEEAEERVNAVLKNVLGEGRSKETVISFIPMIASRDLSLHGAEKLHDLLSKALPSTVMDVKLISPDGKNLSEEEVDRLLLALQAEGLYCHFYPYISDALSFFVLNDSFIRMKQTGADGGAMMDRDDNYVPSPAN